MPASGAGAGVSTAFVDDDAPPPGVQADVAGAELPKIFCSEPLFPAAGAGRRDGPPVGNSGKALFDNFGGGPRGTVRFTDEGGGGPRGAGAGDAPEADADHAVVERLA